MFNRFASTWMFRKPAVQPQDSAFGYHDCMTLCDQSFDRPWREDIVAAHISNEAAKEVVATKVGKEQARS
jgi:hypothetical protein